MLSKDSWKYPSQSSHPVDSRKPGGRQTAAWLRGVPQLCLWANCFIFEFRHAYLYNREDNEEQTLQNGGPLHVTLVLSSPHAHGVESRSVRSPANVESSWKALVVARTSCWGALPDPTLSLPHCRPCWFIQESEFWRLPCGIHSIGNRRQQGKWGFPCLLSSRAEAAD